MSDAESAAIEQDQEQRCRDIYGVIYHGGDKSSLFEKAEALANEGHSGGQYLLGELLADGIGVTKDESRAIAWYRRAAEAGHLHAMNSLGGAYQWSIGVPPDMSAAAKWYRAAAEGGIPSAQLALAKMYAEGEGVAQDFREAHKWISLFMYDLPENPEKGTAEHIFRLEGEALVHSLQASMSSGEIDVAKRLAQAWIERGSRAPYRSYNADAICQKPGAAESDEAEAAMASAAQSTRPAYDLSVDCPQGGGVIVTARAESPLDSDVLRVSEGQFGAAPLGRIFPEKALTRIIMPKRELPEALRKQVLDVVTASCDGVRGEPAAFFELFEEMSVWILHPDGTLHAAAAESSG